MPIDYLAEAEKFRPDEIRILLVGEAPPPSGEKYFYVPCAMNPARPIEADRSLPATVFQHFFKARPKTKPEYESMLLKLRGIGVFLVDVYDKPIRVRNCPEGVTQIRGEVLKLRSKLNHLGIRIADDRMVFLLARKNYASDIRRTFPKAKTVNWKHFRMHPHEQDGAGCQCCPH